MFEEENLDFLDLQQDDDIEKFLICLLENYLNLDQQQKFDYFKKIPKGKILSSLNLIFKILEQNGYDSEWWMFLSDFWVTHKEAGLRQIYDYNDNLRNKKQK